MKNVPSAKIVQNSAVLGSLEGAGGSFGSVTFNLEVLMGDDSSNKVSLIMLLLKNSNNIFLKCHSS